MLPPSARTRSRADDKSESIALMGPRLIAQADTEEEGQGLNANAVLGAELVRGVPFPGAEAGAAKEELWFPTRDEGWRNGQFYKRTQGV